VIDSRDEVSVSASRYRDHLETSYRIFAIRISLVSEKNAERLGQRVSLPVYSHMTLQSLQVKANTVHAPAGACTVFGERQHGCSGGGDPDPYSTPKLVKTLFEQNIFFIFCVLGAMGGGTSPTPPLGWACNFSLNWQADITYGLRCALALWIVEWFCTYGKLQ